jgi:hypothetical protein
MFNVFPFENTLVLMFLSGREIQELVDFITDRSASRGCQSQAQVSGVAFTMNCGQVLDNERHPEARVSPGEDIMISPICIDDVCRGRALDPDATYKTAVNDYIGNGGSGFRVLKRNTTKQDTGVPLRSALIDYIGTLPHCGEYEAETAHYCASPDEGSQLRCADMVDCQAYVAACLRTCATPLATDDIDIPAVCGGTPHAAGPACKPYNGLAPDGTRGDCTGRTDLRGPYAETPCVLGIEDGRIRRKTSDALDTLPDPGEEVPE